MSANARVVVTGATGHVGNVLVRELIARGVSVRAMTLPGESRRPHLERAPIRHRRRGNIAIPGAVHSVQVQGTFMAQNVYNAVHVPDRQSAFITLDVMP